MTAKCPPVENMMKKMCTLLPLLAFFSPARGDMKNFTLYSENVEFEYAQSFCRKHHTDLVTIRNEKENEFFSGSGWIGLHLEKPGSLWKWSRGEELATFFMWQNDEPVPSGHCAYKDGVKWRADTCSSMYPFMCYDEKLVLVKENKTWEEALDHCRSLDEGDTEDRDDTKDVDSPYWNHRYDLATLITRNDHIYARDKAQEATTDEVWTGLCHLGGEWLWVGGEKMQYKDIPRCPTEGFCGVIEKNGTASYGIRNCQLRRNFLCYKKP